MGSEERLCLETKILQVAEPHSTTSMTLMEVDFTTGPDTVGNQQDCKTLNATQMVPLRLVANSGSEGVILYDNERPNNSRSPRPVRLAFESDNSALIPAENQTKAKNQQS
jgi:hypothetical protein